MLSYNISKDKWTETDTPMLQKRNHHSCAMINDHEIMAVGGWNGYNYVKSSEIFNLKQQRWRHGPDLPKGIGMAQFVKAKSETKYLGYLVGGQDDQHFTSSAIYGLDENLNKFLKIGNLTKARKGQVVLNFP